MNASIVHAQLQDACRALDAAEDHAIAAHVGWAMALIEQKYGIPPNQVDATAESDRTHCPA